jgi:hypothetical protein
MAGTNLSFPYDAEIFNYTWRNTPDLILTSMLESGAVVQDSEIAQMISNGSNFFTVPFYDVLGGTEDVYNGVDNFTGATLAGGSYSGVVYGRMAKWSVKSFIKDFNSGADPMAQIIDGVAQFWIKARQTRLIGILGALFGITGDATWTKHITDLSTAGATITDANKIGVTTINDACVKACGDNASAFSLAIMHSTVANRLANLQLLEYSKYTDASGITRDLPIGTINGKLVIVNDGVPVVANDTDTDEFDYTTYVLGLGAIRYASAPVDVPSEMDRNPDTNGGIDMVYTRLRECLAPYGFSFKGDVSTDVGVPDSVLLASASWERKMPAKNIFLAKIVTNG